MSGGSGAFCFCRHDCWAHGKPPEGGCTELCGYVECPCQEFEWDAMDGACRAE